MFLVYHSILSNHLFDHLMPTCYLYYNLIFIIFYMELTLDHIIFTLPTSQLWYIRDCLHIYLFF